MHTNRTRTLSRIRAFFKYIQKRAGSTPASFVPETETIILKDRYKNDDISHKNDVN